MKLAKSIVRLPLKPTPLPWPGNVGQTGTETAFSGIDQTAAAYNYNASMLNPNSAAELTGSRGIISGSLQVPPGVCPI